MTDVINIGIGGSDLGPAMATARAGALRAAATAQPFRLQRRRGRHRPTRCAASIPSRTLFIVSSKTFTTQETMTNAATAARLDRAGRSAKRRSATISPPSRPSSTRSRSSASRPTACSASGTGSAAAIRSGRASACRSRSRSGPSNSNEFLRGGYEIDQHFRDGADRAEHPDADGAAQRLEPQHPRPRHARR